MSFSFSLKAPTLRNKFQTIVAAIAATLFFCKKYLTNTAFCDTISRNKKESHSSGALYKLRRTKGSDPLT